MSNGAKVELWLVRHGETEWSADGRHTSTTDIPLTDHGRERARELKEYLAGKQFAAVFVSPMQRAKQTCEIAGYADAAIVDQNLMEWNYGESEGKTTAEMREKYGPDWSVWTNEIVGGESVEQVGGRADKVIARSLAAVAIGPGAGKSTQVALFAHAHILRILAVRWIGLPAVNGAKFALGTGSLSVLGFERETRVISRWNRSFEE
ncbi:MAG TPA: histidine phosphatase family protein [Gemmatimonadaceae bacterium]|jgi:probable phosphoglycerate mutase